MTKIKNKVFTIMITASVFAASILASSSAYANGGW